jgi:hypothetical protein
MIIRHGKNVNLYVIIISGWNNLPTHSFERALDKNGIVVNNFNTWKIMTSSGKIITPEGSVVLESHSTYGFNIIFTQRSVLAQQKESRKIFLLQSAVGVYQR